MVVQHDLYPVITRLCARYEVPEIMGTKLAGPRVMLF
jgi:hypothetical protein